MLLCLHRQRVDLLVGRLEVRLSLPGALLELLVHLEEGLPLVVGVLPLAHQRVLGVDEVQKLHGKLLTPGLFRVEVAEHAAVVVPDGAELVLEVLDELKILPPLLLELVDALLLALCCHLKLHHVVLLLQELVLKLELLVRRGLEQRRVLDLQVDEDLGHLEALLLRHDPLLLKLCLVREELVDAGVELHDLFPELLPLLEEAEAHLLVVNNLLLELVDLQELVGGPLVPVVVLTEAQCSELPLEHVNDVVLLSQECDHVPRVDHGEVADAIKERAELQHKRVGLVVGGLHRSDHQGPAVAPQHLGQHRCDL
mmetsp:Transcript_6358/g.16289  ORF Transcript_6358/g.16289 Transcript_6358/m.16289 type:complete len:312 (-) Transcript_6358:989-1924(-)